MKSLIAMVCLIGSLSAFGQGYLAFANLGAGVNSPFHDINGVLLNGSGYNVEMLVGPSATEVTDSLTPLFAGNFTSGYFNGGSRTVPAADVVNGRTWVIIRVRDGVVFSPPGEGWVTPGMSYGMTPAFQVTVQPSAQVPANPLVGMPLINGNGNLVMFPVPEPSACVLGFLGVVALIGCRRLSR